MPQPLVTCGKCRRSWNSDPNRGAGCHEGAESSLTGDKLITVFSPTTSKSRRPHSARRHSLKAQTAKCCVCHHNDQIFAASARHPLLDSGIKIKVIPSWSMKFDLLGGTSQLAITEYGFIHATESRPLRTPVLAVYPRMAPIHYSRIRRRRGKARYLEVLYVAA